MFRCFERVYRPATDIIFPCDVVLMLPKNVSGGPLLKKHENIVSSTSNFLISLRKTMFSKLCVKKSQEHAAEQHSDF